MARSSDGIKQCSSTDLIKLCGFIVVGKRTPEIKFLTYNQNAKGFGSVATYVHN